jgi:hypothetical protein
VATALASFAACHAEADVPTRLPAPSDAADIDEAELPGALPIEPTLISATTYEGSGELVHPDAVFFPKSWHGHRYWVSATPYPSGNPLFENPSIFTGSSSREMLVPTGAINPLAKPDAKAYLSDPDLTLDPERNELRMYYRQTLQLTDQLYVATSKDGVRWEKGRLVLEGARYSLISPAIVREGPGAWRMWTVSAVIGGCQSVFGDVHLEQRTSSDGLKWGEPSPVALTIPRRIPWHWDVQWVNAKKEYWALIAAYPQGTSCSQTSIYFARSTDGTQWDVSPTPLLSANTFAPIRDLVYRSTFHYHEGSDAVSVWYSGARLEGIAFHYAVASARYPMSELLRRVSVGSAAKMERERMQPTPELTAARKAFVNDFP